RPFAKRSFATKSSIFKDFTKAGLKSIVLRLSCSATVNLPIISNASLIVGISNYLLRWYCFLLLLYAISRQKSTICCDRAINKKGIFAGQFPQWTGAGRLFHPVSGAPLTVYARAAAKSTTYM